MEKVLKFSFITSLILASKWEYCDSVLHIGFSQNYKTSGNKATVINIVSFEEKVVYFVIWYYKTWYPFFQTEVTPEDIL